MSLTADIWRSASLVMPPEGEDDAPTIDCLAKDTPEEIRALSRLAGGPGLDLLEDFDADAAGLVVFGQGQDREICRALRVREGEALGVVVGLDYLDSLAQSLGKTRVHRPGWFACLLVGSEASSLGYLVPGGRDDFERSAS